jgi:exosortase
MSESPAEVSVGRPSEVHEAEVRPPRLARPESLAVRARWPVATSLALVFAAILAGLYSQVFPVWFEDVWADDNSTHALIVPFFSAFVIWQRRKALAALTPRGTWVGLLVILVGLAQLFVGDIAAETFSMRTSFIAVLAGLILFNLGPHYLRLLAFPLAFLLFTVPIPRIFFYAVAFPLQRLAAENAAWGLDLIGVPVLLDGNVIHLSRITLGVTEACSGIRSLVSLVALAVAWAHLTLPWLWGGIALVIAAVPITILANAGRVVATGLIAQSFGVEYAQGFFHTFAGWAIFIFAFVWLLGVHGLIQLVGTWRRRSRT